MQKLTARKFQRRTSLATPKLSRFPYLKKVVATGSLAVMGARARPTLPTLALQQVGSYLRYTGRDANIVAEAALDPKRSFSGSLCTIGATEQETLLSFAPLCIRVLVRIVSIRKKGGD